MWTKYRVELQITGPFAASLPKTEKEIRAMLENRQPRVVPPDAIPLAELGDQVVAEVGASDEFLPGWATFKRDAVGVYYEGRTVRGHIKDCAMQIAGLMKGGAEGIVAFKAKVANRVYVEEDCIPMMRNGTRIIKPDGMEERFIRVMTKQGPRSTIKYVDYVTDPHLTFTLLLMDDGVITEGHLRSIFEYGAVHGMGAERSQGWGRYTAGLTKF